MDRGDHSLAREWFGSEGEAGRACGLRKLSEETGLVGTSAGLVEASGRLPGEDGFPPPIPGQVRSWLGGSPRSSQDV